MLRYQIEKMEETSYVQFEGDIDIDATELMQELQKQLHQQAHVVLNMKQVPFVDSTGIGLLIQLVKELKDSGTDVKIREVRPEVYEVFQLLSLQIILGDEVFE